MISFLEQAVSRQPLAGGTIHGGWLVTDADGRRYAVKKTPRVPPDLFQTEAEGLAALRDTGVVGAPRVIEVGADYLVLEALDPRPGLDDDAFWERTGQALARLHARRGERFGWHRDNWLGMVRQVNTWTDDGYEFFARYRILRYLSEPNVRAMLDRRQRSGVERICERLPRLVPPSYPALTHGDLWPGNIMAGTDGSPTLIDPAISWNWPATDTSMMLCSGAPERFFAAYHEIRPPEPGWRDHLRLLHLRELLTTLAHPPGSFDWIARVPGEIADLIRQYA